ncbi:MAG: S8 family serine peptidase [Candidatus Altiarchaeales archaeon]|nr:S8 family serine peptidase [Candidatus Altiarchaeales archaeon]MBD3416895.1 S8 family serine peptidase [Candidatus Altiarchaeales archaeon]
MKRTNQFLGILVALLVVSLLVAASTAEKHRVYVKGSPAARGLAKGLVEARHEFKGAFSAEASASKIEVLNAIPGIEIEPVPVYHITAPPFSKCGDGECQGFESPDTCPADCGGGGGECYPDNAIPWGVQKVNGGTGGSGVIVAVLDTGLDQDHPDLVGNLVACEGLRFGTCADGHGHGTHVAGTVLANGKIKGVAPDAGLMAVKVCTDSGSCYADDVAAGVDYAVANGANIISMSFGGPDLASVEKTAYDNAAASGVLLIAAAGNSGPGTDTIEYPGAYYKVMAVAAIDSSENVASFSSRGLSDGDSDVEERELDVAAPGVSVESTTNDGCYGYSSGTSMATPHVSGLAAKLWQGSAQATRDYLDFTVVKDLSPAGHDIYTGFGLPIAPGCTSDTDCSSGELCCSGQCRAAACDSDISCDDGIACTVDSCTFAGTCDASCSHTEITQCVGGDGCCPANCDFGNDSDCSATTCGNGVCEGNGEDCHSCPGDCACVGRNCERGCCGDGIFQDMDNKKCQTI